MQRSLDVPPPLKSPFIRPHLDSRENGLKNRLPIFASASGRIWGLVIGICALIIITKLFASHSTDNHSFYNQDALHPINYFNTSGSPAPPFQFCPTHGPGDVVGNKYGAHAMARSRLHLGSGARVQRLIHRVEYSLLYAFHDC
jgi:hypothetical protein